MTDDEKFFDDLAAAEQASPSPRRTTDDGMVAVYVSDAVMVGDGSTYEVEHAGDGWRCSCGAVDCRHAALAELGPPS